MCNVVSYDLSLKFLARSNRKKSTLAEALLWTRIRKKQVCGYLFLRQKPVIGYIMDFYCPSLKLAIEVDGSSHDMKDIGDEERQDELELIGIRFLRFTNQEIEENPDGTVVVIKKWIKEHC